MTQISVTGTIAAPLDVVFNAVADIENLPKTNPDIVRIEFLSERRSGVGTRFRETRLMRGKEAVTELEITEQRENEHVRIVTDSHGTVWDTTFTVKSVGSNTELTLTMDARPHKLLPKLLNPLLKGMFRKGIAKYVRDMAKYCESQVTAPT